MLFDGAIPTNEEGLRFADEPARHGNLLALAALTLLGGPAGSPPKVELLAEEPDCGLLADLLRCALVLPAQPAAEAAVQAMPQETHAAREPLDARIS